MKKRSKKPKFICFERTTNGIWKHKRHLMIHPFGWCYCSRCGFTAKFHNVDRTKLTVKSHLPKGHKSKIIGYTPMSEQLEIPRSRFPSVQRLIDQRLKVQAPSENMDKTTKSEIKKKIVKKAKETIKKSKPIAKKAASKVKVTVSSSLKDLKTKMCPHCKKRKAIDQFGTRTIKGKKYAQSQCKECR